MTASVTPIRRVASPIPEEAVAQHRAELENLLNCERDGFFDPAGGGVVTTRMDAIRLQIVADGHASLAELLLAELRGTLRLHARQRSRYEWGQGQDCVEADLAETRDRIDAYLAGHR